MSGIGDPQILAISNETRPVMKGEAKTTNGRSPIPTRKKWTLTSNVRVGLGRGVEVATAYHPSQSSVGAVHQRAYLPLPMFTSTTRGTWSLRRPPLSERPHFDCSQVPKFRDEYVVDLKWLESPTAHSMSNLLMIFSSAAALNIPSLGVGLTLLYLGN